MAPTLPQRNEEPAGRRPVRELTARMDEVMRLRRQKYSYRQIAKRLGLDVSTVYESHMAGLKAIGLEIPKAVIERSEQSEYRRLEESDHAEAVMREYWDTYQAARDKGQLKTAVEALNGLRGWSEMMIRLHGTDAPIRHQVEVTMTHIEREIAALEARENPDGTYTV